MSKKTTMTRISGETDKIVLEMEGFSEAEIDILQSVVEGAAGVLSKVEIDD